jgi:arylsulfatase A-like enzyme
MPQIAHAPWLELGPGDDLPSRGHALQQLQVRWLAEVVRMLEEAGALGNTVVVLTADHGIRTTVEDPAFRRGTIDSYSFQVPFALYAPRTFEGRQFTHALTSHIDIEPSLSALLGVRNEEAYSEGVPLWAASEDRRIYFFAEAYGGASGFYEKDYFMSNLITDQQFRSPAMSFRTDSLAPMNGKPRDYVKDALSRFRSLHFDIVSERGIAEDTTKTQSEIVIAHSGEND